LFGGIAAGLGALTAHGKRCCCLVCDNLLCRRKLCCGLGLCFLHQRCRCRQFSQSVVQLILQLGESRFTILDCRRELCEFGSALGHCRLQPPKLGGDAL